MSTLLIGIAALCLAVLVILDLTVMRGADRFDGSTTEDDEALTPMWKDDVPGTVKAGRWAGLALGVTSFPATLAPVVITVLAFQKHPVLSHGWISLVAVIVAGVSMSAAVKYLRTAHLFRGFAQEMKKLLKHTVIYQGLWTFFVLIMLVLMRSPESGRLVALIWGYVAISIVGFALTALAAKQALVPDEVSSF